MYAFQTEKLMTKKVDLVKTAIKIIEHKQKLGETNPERITQEQAASDYKELLTSLPLIPDLTIEERKELHNEINDKLFVLGFVDHSEYNATNLIDEETFIQAIERVNYQHRYDAGAMFGTLTEKEALRDYNIILSVLEQSELTPEVKETLKAMIDAKISQIPEVEAEKTSEEQQYTDRLMNAFNDAKIRFKNLSAYEKMIYKMQGKDPESLDPNNMEIEEVRGLYKK